MAFRITRANMDALMEALDNLESPIEVVKENLQTWLNGQDEVPKTRDVREEIATAREEFEAELPDLQAALAAVTAILE